MFNRKYTLESTKPIVCMYTYVGAMYSWPCFVPTYFTTPFNICRNSLTANLLNVQYPERRNR